MTADTADTILRSGRIVTMDHRTPQASAVAITGDVISAVGGDREVEALRGPRTHTIELNGRTVVPGLNDSHLHLIRGGLNYSMELRWEGVPSLSDALRMLREQAIRTPPPQWVRVIGGWSEFQFAERRAPTLAEINAVSGDTPVMILHLYTYALLNRAAMRALGYSRDTPNPPRGVIGRDSWGDPTGLLIAQPDPHILYAAIAGAPKLAPEDQVTSTVRFFRELNRLGITSAIDAGGGFQAYPDDYGVVKGLARDRELSVRIAMNLFTQRPGEEMEDFQRWANMTAPGSGDDFLKVNGVGEMIRYKCYDFENFELPRPDPLRGGETELAEALRFLVENRWPFRMHATYDESVRSYLDVIEAIDDDIGLSGLRWFFDHCETVSEQSIERIARLGGGIAIQDRMAFAGEHFIARYGAEAAARTPPIPEMLTAGLPVGAGTDATRVSSYNPWVSLAWLVTGCTVGGTRLQPPERCLDRVDALRAYTQGSAWFSGDEARKGTLALGNLADLAVLSDDYFTVPADQIAHITSVLTIVGGRIAHASSEFAQLAPPMPRSAPDWAPDIEVARRTDHVNPGANPLALPHLAHCQAGCAGHSPMSLVNGAKHLLDPFAGACWAY
jgi:predicted amidohydrolase YtcJ